MRWFVRIAAAVTLSALAVVALTVVGWPRPRFVVPLPAMGKSASVQSEASLDLEPASVQSDRPNRSSSPWIGFVITDTDPTGKQFGIVRKDFWFLNGEDGRTAGPFDGRAVRSHSWDYRGAAVVNGVVPPSVPRAGPLGRFDPDAGAYTPIAGDRAEEFVLSANGETLLTFTVPKEVTAQTWRDPPGDADLVCFDLTADPPRRQRLDFVIPQGQPRPGVRLNLSPVRFGSVALAPDGRTLAVSELWFHGRRSSDPGVTLFDTRTGQRVARLTDYGPPNPVGAGEGAFGLVFSPDSRFLRFNRLSKPFEVPLVHSLPAEHRLGHFTDATRRLIDLATGAYVPPPHLGYTPDRRLLPGPIVLRTDDGSRRLETDGDPAGGDRPFRFRVVDADGTPRCDWRTLPVAERGGLPIAPGGQFVPGTTGLVWTNATPAPPPSQWGHLLRRLLRQPAPASGPGVEVVWYDWAADELRVVRRYAGTRPGNDSVQVFVQEGRVAVLCHRLSEGEAVVEVWDDPPPRRPWPWSVPAGVAVGVLLTAAGVRVPRRRPVLVV